MCGLLARCIVKALGDGVLIEIILVKRLINAAIATDGQALTGMYEAVDGVGTLLAGGNSINSKLRT